jgi:hypothetical protein
MRLVCENWSLLYQIHCSTYKKEKKKQIGMSHTREGIGCGGPARQVEGEQ